MIGAVLDMARGASRWRTSYKLGLQDIELRYKRSLLGPFWISASLIATVLALAFVFADVFQQEYLEYISFLAAGLLAWQLILTLMNEGCGSVTEHGAYLQNIPMPVTVIAGRIAFRNAIVFLHNFAAVIGVLLMLGARFSPAIVMVAPGVATILAIGYFMSMVLGPICARFRDIPLVVQSSMQVIFFLTPIFWMPSAVSHRPMFTSANPFYHLIELVRAPLLGHAPDPISWTVALWFCAGAAGAALITVALTRKRMNLWL